MIIANSSIFSTLRASAGAPMQHARAYLKLGADFPRWRSVYEGNEREI